MRFECLGHYSLHTWTLLATRRGHDSLHSLATTGYTLIHVEDTTHYTVQEWFVIFVSRVWKNLIGEFIITRRDDISFTRRRVGIEILFFDFEIGERRKKFAQRLRLNFFPKATPGQKTNPKRIASE